MEIITVLIADDHVIFRKGLRAVLNEIPTLKVTAEATNGHEVLEEMKQLQADVILMDIKMPVMDGIETTKKVKEKYPETQVIALTMHEEIGYFNKMIQSGAMGFLLKRTGKKQLADAIENVYAGGTYFSEEFIMNETEHGLNRKTKSQVKLSEREKQVLKLICQGNSNAEIAKYLGLSQRTIDGHRSRLFDKTGAKNAPNLVLFAMKNNLIEI
ncbi:MAG: response regulator transcription factor [Bacteroidota bacterium]|nr:response regulator transcription factor [Bacteroidota bacterium]